MSTQQTIFIFTSKFIIALHRREKTVRTHVTACYTHWGVEIIPLNKCETTVSWQGTEFYTHADVDIIPINGSETTVSWQGTEFYTHVDADSILLNKSETTVSWQRTEFLFLLKYCHYSLKSECVNLYCTPNRNIYSISDNMDSKLFCSIRILHYVGLQYTIITTVVCQLYIYIYIWLLLLTLCLHNHGEDEGT
jgi:hypothetical protein